MSKAILILDEMPDSCYKCPLNYDMYTCLLVTNSSTIAMDERRLDDCPLKELPDKLSMDDYDEHVPENCEKLLEYYNDGFNDCLNQILGTEE